MKLVAVWRFLAGSSNVAPFALLLALAGGIWCARLGSPFAPALVAGIVGAGFIASLFERN